jgi:hypothetical protein
VLGCVLQRKFSLRQVRKRRIAPYRCKTEVYAGSLHQDLTKSQYAKVHAMVSAKDFIPAQFPTYEYGFAKTCARDVWWLDYINWLFRLTCTCNCGWLIPCDQEMFVSEHLIRTIGKVEAMLPLYPTLDTTIKDHRGFGIDVKIVSPLTILEQLMNNQQILTSLCWPVLRNTTDPAHKVLVGQPQEGRLMGTDPRFGQTTWTRDDGVRCMSSNFI